MKKWNMWRVSAFVAGWILYVVAIAWLCDLPDPRKSIFGFMVLCSITFLMALYAICRPFKSITVALVFALLSSQLPAKETKPEPQPNVAAGCVMGVLVIAGGIYITYKLYKFCTKMLPPTPPNPPPPPPPTTNSPSVSSSSRFVTYAQPTPRASYQVVGDEGFAVWDISSLGYVGVDGQPFYALFRTTFLTATNLAGGWGVACTITGYVSASHVLSVCYNEAGQPFCTNWTVRSDNVTVNLPVPDAPQRFFKNQQLP